MRQAPGDDAKGHEQGGARGQHPEGSAAGDRPRSDPARAAVLRQALSVGIASGAYAISFGALSVAAGLTLAQTCALSLLMFTGGSQFAFVGILGAGGGAVPAVATAGLLGIRNGFYGLQMASLLRPRGLARPLTAQLTIDESTAVGSAQQVVNPARPELVRVGFYATGLAVFVFWNSATVLGAVLGDRLGDPRRYGLDAAAAAAFLALVWPRVRAAVPRRVALGAVAVALLLVPVTPAGVPVICAGLVGVAAAWGPRQEAR